MTETWLSPGRQEKLAEDLLLGSGINLWTRSRQPGPNGTFHGGVAIAACSSNTSMKPFNITNPGQFEILAITGKVKGVDRKFFIIAAYVPPNYAVPRAKECLKVIYNSIMDIKRRFEDPYIVVAGDFNQWKIDSALEDYVDLWEISGGPTRGGRTIDRVLSNLPPPQSTTCAVHPPLESEDDSVSDHRLVCVTTEIDSKERSLWQIHTYRKTTKKSEAAFIAELHATDWHPVAAAVGVENKHRLFQERLDYLMDKHFPFQTSRRREKDLPWLDNVAKKKIRRKKAIYRDEGKSPRWHLACANLDNYLNKRRENFLENQRNKLLGSDASKHFFKNVKDFSSAEKPKSFSVTDLLPEKPANEVAEEAASFFNSISQEFQPLQHHEIPTSFERILPKLTVYQVAMRLREQRKPGSMVVGDIFPKLVNDCADVLAVPLTSIFNEIVREGVWPSKWKIEHVTLIPKKSLPSSFADLRNISCTAFFSKVMETFVLQWAMEEVGLKSNQYGGVKGCSTTHMLLDIWQDICSNLEDHRCSTVLTSIDYAKAFNRLSFQKCLQSFHKKGASSTVLRLLASFLAGRYMRVRAGSEWSQLKRVDGGCPQGSILGVFLFNITTDDLEDPFVEFEHQQFQGRFEVLANARNVPQHLLVPPHEEAVGTQSLKKKPTVVYKYVDDNIISEKLNFGQTDAVLIGYAMIKERLAVSSQNAFRTIVRNAVDKGMMVNSSKTNVICINDALNHERKTFIEDEDGEKICSENTMKILGFNFTNRPTMSAQVSSIIKKFRQRYWSLRHLGKLGFNKEELVRVYKSNIRPVADYTDVVYHSLLTDEQDELLENAQNAALRCIFDPRLSARKLRALAGVETLRQRRISHADKFAAKCIASDRFKHLFPIKSTRTSSRNVEKYVEEYARCDRLKNLPLFFMRRRMNGKEGKSYGERYRVYRES